MNQTSENDPEAAPPDRNAAKEQLVSTVAASWGAIAAERAIPSITAATTDAERRVVLEKLAQSILSEGARRFSEPVLAEVWREAANEAACARLSAVE